MMLSLRQINHRHLHFPAWLGIVAILMLFIAPVVSKSLASAGALHSMMPGMSMPGMDMSSMEMAMPEHAMHPAMSEDNANHPDTHHTMPSHSKGQGGMFGDMSDAACGYCVLLVHLPLLHLLALTLQWSSDFQRGVAPSTVATPFVPPVFYSDAQPRAPPVSQ